MKNEGQAEKEGPETILSRLGAIARDLQDALEDARVVSDAPQAKVPDAPESQPSSAIGLLEHEIERISLKVLELRSHVDNIRRRIG